MEDSGHRLAFLLLFYYYYLSDVFAGFFCSVRLLAVAHVQTNIIYITWKYVLRLFFSPCAYEPPPSIRAHMFASAHPSVVCVAAVVCARRNVNLTGMLRYSWSEMWDKMKKADDGTEKNKIENKNYKTTADFTIVCWLRVQMRTAASWKSSKRPWHRSYSGILVFRSLWFSFFTFALFVFFVRLFLATFKLREWMCFLLLWLLFA